MPFQPCDPIGSQRVNCVPSIFTRFTDHTPTPDSVRNLINKNKTPQLVTAVASGNWSSGSTWSTGSVPGAGKFVYIPAGFTVTLGQAEPTTVEVEEIYVAGALKFANVTITLTLKNLIVWTEGKLWIGADGTETDRPTDITQTTPAAPTVTPSTTGGTLAGGTYNVAVTAAAAGGETAGSAQSAAVVGAGSTGSITVTAPSSQAGSTGYHVYAAAAGQPLTRITTTPVAYGTNYVITAMNPGSAAVPTAAGLTPLWSTVTINIKAFGYNCVREVSEMGNIWERTAHGIWAWGQVSIVGTRKNPEWSLLGATVDGTTTPQTQITLSSAQLDNGACVNKSAGPQVNWLDNDLLAIARGGTAVPNDDLIVAAVPADDYYMDNDVDPNIYGGASIHGGNELVRFQLSCSTGTVLNLKASTPVTKLHEGETTFNPGASPATYLRQAEVLNLTRNITIKSALDCKPPFNGNGHCAFFGRVKLRHCAMVDLGINRHSTDLMPAESFDRWGIHNTSAKIGRYPVHLHKPQKLEDGWKDFEGVVVNRGHFHGFVLHRVRTAKLTNCIAYNVMGHGYYIELADEDRVTNLFLSTDYMDNVFKGCIAGKGYPFLTAGTTTFRGTPARPIVSNGQDHSAAFWFGASKQQFTNCRAFSFISGFGIGYVDQWGSDLAPFFYAECHDEKSGDPVNLGECGPPVFVGNITHHCTRGHYSSYTRKTGSQLMKCRGWGNNQGAFDYGFQKRYESWGTYADPGAEENNTALAVDISGGLPAEKNLTDGSQFEFISMDTTFTGWESNTQSENDSQFYDMVLNNGYIGLNHNYGGVALTRTAGNYSGPGYRILNCVLENNNFDVCVNTDNSGRSKITAKFKNCIFKSRFVNLFAFGPSLRNDGSLEYWPPGCYWDFINCAFVGDALTSLQDTFPEALDANGNPLRHWRLIPQTSATAPPYQIVPIDPY